MLVRRVERELGGVWLTGCVPVSQCQADHSRTLKKEFSTDFIHESRPLFVWTTLALGYSASSSSVKLTHGASVVASTIFYFANEERPTTELRCIFPVTCRAEQAL